MRRHTPKRADKMHIGTIRMMASGRLQLSYCAASTRDHVSTTEGQHGRQQRQLDAAGQRDLAGQAVLQREVGPLKPMPRGRSLSRRSHLGLGLAARSRAWARH